MPDFRRLARSEVSSTDPTRRGKVDVVYMYMDDQFVTYIVTVPAEEDTPERVRQELERRVASAGRGGPETISL